jgi:hypothetical protein
MAVRSISNLPGGRLRLEGHFYWRLKGTLSLTLNRTTIVHTLSLAMGDQKHDEKLVSVRKKQGLVSTMSRSTQSIAGSAASMKIVA